MPNVRESFLGSKGIRSNRLIGGMKGDKFVTKLPRELESDEYNVALGIGRSVALGAGASITLTTSAPRDLILREMVINDDAGPVSLAELGVTAVTVEGNTAQLGTEIGAGTYSPDNPNRPQFDLPAGAGTPISVTVINNGAGAHSFTVAFAID